MAAFKFSLSSLLRLREHAKNQKRWELRSLFQTRKDILAEIDALEKCLLSGRYHPADNQILTAYELAILAEHGERVVELIKTKRKLLREMDAIITTKRTELIDSMRAVKLLEQLRKRQEERYRLAESRAQQHFIDEVAQRNFVQPQARKKIPS